MNLPGPKSAAIIARDAACISPSANRAYPFVADYGKGCLMWDVDGNRYLDFAAGIATSSTGYNHPDITRAINKQAEKMVQLCGQVFYSEPQVTYAERLAPLAPIQGNSDNRVFFCNSGAEAWDGALKLARWKTGRQNIICFYGAFHGRTFGGFSTNATKAVYRQGFGPIVPGIYHGFFPTPFKCPSDKEVPTTTEGCLNYIKDYLFAKLIAPTDVAAIALEPIQGEGGYIVPPPEFLQGLRQICDEHGILLIMDEVQSGMGRTGKLFACEHFGVKPDIITTAKGIASGYPMAAFIANEDVMSWPKGAHGSTYGGGPLACVVANRTLDLLQNGLTDNAANVGAYLLDQLKSLMTEFDCVGDVRGIGLMIGIEIVERLPSGHVKPATALKEKIIDMACQKGLLLLGCGTSTIRICPPLVVSAAQADIAVDIIRESIKEVKQHG
jgi:4-aminobutyrate aminotransferase